MNSLRKRAARIALYLDCAGGVPLIVGSNYREYLSKLQQQFASVNPETRKQARKAGRRLIRYRGGLAAIAKLLVSVPPRQRADPELRRERNRRQHEKYLDKWLHSDSQTPLCPVCRMRCGLPS